MSDGHASVAGDHTGCRFLHVLYCKGIRVVILVAALLYFIL